MDYFGDGQKIGANIEYVVESKRLGTAGALWLIQEKLKEPFFVMNGDILTSVDFSDMQNYHSSHNAMATMAVREYAHQVPYGVVELQGEKICSIKEKPIQKFFISAGIYFLEPQALEFVSKDEFFDMPTLFERIVLNSHSAISFPIREYWLDIGKMADFERANSDFSEVFQG
jgi:NDP-sugar pyrophosphorylase family protein